MTDYSKKLEIISKIFGNDYVYKENRSQVLVYCPNCHHHKRKLCITLDKEIFHCFVCDYGKKLHAIDLIKQYGNEQLVEEWKQVSNKSYEEKSSLLDELFKKDISKQQEKFSPFVELPKEAISILDNLQSVYAQHAMNFLYKRGLTYRDIKTYNFHYCESGAFSNRVVVPSYTLQGQINFFVARLFMNAAPEVKKYMYPTVPKENIIFNELFITWERPVVLVEGVFDALKVNFNSVPLLGNILNEDSLLFNNIVKYKQDVILMLDSDKAGRDAFLKNAALLLDWGVRLYTVDLNGFKDPGEMPREEISKSLKERVLLTRSELMRENLE